MQSTKYAELIFMQSTKSCTVQNYAGCKSMQSIKLCRVQNLRSATVHSEKLCNMENYSRCSSSQHLSNWHILQLLELAYWSLGKLVEWVVLLTVHIWKNWWIELHQQRLLASGWFFHNGRSLPQDLAEARIEIHSDLMIAMLNLFNKFSWRASIVLTICICIPTRPQSGSKRDKVGLIHSE